MSEQISFEILHQSQKWLSQLGQELSVLTGWGPIAHSLRELRIRLGDPRERLGRLTPADLAGAGAEGAPGQQEWFDSRFDYYTLTQTVSISPALSIEVDSLACRLAFADENVVIEAMFPPPATSALPKPVPGMALGLNGQLEWEVGIPRKDEGEANADGGPPEEMQYADQMQAPGKRSLVVAPGYQFALDYVGLAAHGIGENEAEWRLENPVFADEGKLEFVLVFRVPAGTVALELLGRAIVEPDISWLADGLGFYVKELPKPLAAILRKRDEERAGAERLPIGTYSKWQIELPQAEEAGVPRVEEPELPHVEQVEPPRREREVAPEQVKAERLRLTLAADGDADHGVSPSYLRETVLPTLQALIDMQQVIGEIQGRPPEAITIHALNWDSRSVDLSGGIRDAAVLVLELVVPWRREHAQELAGAEAKSGTELALAGLARKLVKAVGAELTEEEQVLYAMKVFGAVRVLGTGAVEVVGVGEVNRAGEGEEGDE